MAAGAPVIRVLKGGRPVLTVGAGLQITGTLSAPDTFDRVEFYLRGMATAPVAVIDAVPAGGVPDPSLDTYVSFTQAADGSVASVSLRCLVRCYIAGGMEPFVRIEGLLTPSTQVQGWLRFSTLQIGSDVYSAASGNPDELELDRFTEKTGRVPQGLDPVLPAVLGLRIKIGQSGDTTASFVPTPQSAQPFEDYHEPSTMKAVRFIRPIALERSNQEVAVGPLRIAIPADQIADLGLDGGCASDAGITPARLVQTHLALNDDLQLDPPSVGRWAVTIQGVPSPGVVAAWNAVIADPYLAALGTVSAGQPISALPRLRIPEDPAAPPCHSGVATRNGAADPLWMAVLGVVDHKTGRDPLRPADFDPKPQPVEVIALRSVQPVKVANQLLLQCNATFEAFVCHDGGMLQTRVGLFSPLAQAGKRTAGGDDVDLSRVESANVGFVFALRPCFRKGRVRSHPSGRGSGRSTWSSGPCLTRRREHTGPTTGTTSVGTSRC